MNKHKKLVFDTNTLISAATYVNSLPARVFGQAKQVHEIFISAETIAELEGVLARKKFDRYFSDDEARRYHGIRILTARQYAVEEGVL